MEESQFSTSLYRSLELFSVDSNSDIDSESLNKYGTPNICYKYASETFLGFDNDDSKNNSKETVVDLTKSDDEIDNKLSYQILNTDNFNKNEKDTIFTSNKQNSVHLLCNKEEKDLNSEHNTINKFETKQTNTLSNLESVCFLNDIKLQCDICCKQFDNTVKLSRHNCKVVSNVCKFCKKLLRRRFSMKKNNAHVCVLCNKEFASRRVLFRHFKVHSTEVGRVKCRRCKKHNVSNEGVVFDSDSSSNVFDDLKMEPKDLNNFFKCSVCCLDFESELTLEKHIITCKVKNENIEYNNSTTVLNCLIDKYSCSDCNKCFKTKLKLKKHISNVHFSLKNDVESSFICHHCGESFSKESELVAHLKSNHAAPQSKKFCCHKCGKLFSAKWTLKVHVRSHYGETSYKCETCCKTFARKDTLTRHRILHADRKPHGCQVCGKCFTERAKLVLHHRVHSGEKPFACQHCGRRFSANSDLKRHILRKHSVQISHNRDTTVPQSDTMFFCDLCGKGFGMKCSLRSHMKVHSGIKPFECNECGKAFNRNWNMKSHARTHTKAAISSNL